MSQKPDRAQEDEAPFGPVPSINLMIVLPFCVFAVVIGLIALFGGF